MKIDDIIKQESIGHGLGIFDNNEIKHLENTVFEKKGKPHVTCFVSNEEASRVSHAKVKNGDLLVSRSGTLGLTVPINKELENSIFGSYFIRIRPNIEINRDYLAFYLNSLLGKIQVEQISTGSIQTNLTIPTIESIKVLMIEPEFQEKISDLIKESKSLKKQAKDIFQKGITQLENEIEIIHN
ncbi:MAG: hypothetical protein KGH88_09370 [Thaumarchaeota archaeon]|nr:hypothetical protein [Nitrososphaerota archaeon]